MNTITAGRRAKIKGRIKDGKMTIESIYNANNPKECDYMIDWAVAKMRAAGFKGEILVQKRTHEEHSEVEEHVVPAEAQEQEQAQTQTDPF